ncbi:NUDIX hydrolase [Brevifollis gellanilyticus]|uniref:NUDIX hydrolase n=1 Tax=Brevifollis gellanilyticus TaxID=748831 RepID=A0A512MAS7_9BACT|nr:NUDIX domain-containing protein [Brevifollis gellanilyticus]GEP43834.1 NUDIX hydrolase [Brevifollis gellanilyticus]
MKHTYQYPRAALTVDCVVFGFDGGDLQVLLIRRAIPPFKDHWALPGGFVRVEETLDEAARRELVEETGLKDVFLEQLYTFGTIDRDPRERVVSIAYYALVKPADHTTAASTDAAEARWYPITGIPPLAFDHATILDIALKRLRGKLTYQPVGFELLPAKFTLTQLQRLYEAVLGTEIDKRNFRKKVLSFDLLIPLKEQLRDGPHRPAQLFRFDPVKYERLKKKGFLFEI